MPLYGARNTSVTVPSLRNKPDARAGVILCGTQQIGNVDAAWENGAEPRHGKGRTAPQMLPAGGELSRKCDLSDTENIPTLCHRPLPLIHKVERLELVRVRSGISHAAVWSAGVRPGRRARPGATRGPGLDEPAVVRVLQGQAVRS